MAPLLLLLSLLFGHLATPGVAQVMSGSIVGTVTDQSGALIPGATITLTNADTGFERKAVANTSGQYTAENIPTGTYKITAVASGFQTLVQTGVALDYGRILTLGLQLTVGTTKESLEVKASAPLLQAQTGTVSYLVSNIEAQELPLNGRSFTSLLLLSPGTNVGMSSGLATGAYSQIGSVNYTVNGSTPQANSYLLDGLFNRGLWEDNLTISPVLDSIHEMNVMAGNYDAEYGDSGGAVTIVETKSGTNEYHGDVFEYLENTDLTANNFFNNRAGIHRPPFHYNQFGGTFGGPIRRNKTFFFGDYQGTRSSQPQTYTSTIPTAAQVAMVQTGNFSALGTPIYNPYSVSTNSAGATVRAPFAGNVIPVSMLSPQAVTLAGMLPAATNAGTANNFTYVPSQTSRMDQTDFRVDENVGSKDRLFAKYSYDRALLFVPGRLPAPASSPIPIGPFMDSSGNTEISAGPMQNQSATVDYVRMIGPTTVNDVQAGVVRWKLTVVPTDSAFNSDTVLGVPGQNGINAYSGGLSSFGITGFENIGDNSTYPENSYTTTYQYDDNLTLVRGSHTLKFGVLYIRNQLNGFSGAGHGGFSFNGQYARQIGSSTSATALADFALGVPSSASRNILIGSFGERFWQFGAYAEDSWRVTNKLTLSYGLRYDLFAPPYEIHNHYANLNLQTGLLEIAGQNGNGRRLVNFAPTNFSPRLSLAYAPDSKTVFRAGLGGSYVIPNITGNELYKNLPWYTSYTLSTDQNGVPANTIANGFPLPTLIPLTDTADLSTGSPTIWNQNLKDMQVIQMSAGVQRQLQPNLMLSVSYVRTRTINMTDHGLNVNQSIPGPGAQGPREPYYTINPNLAVGFRVFGNTGQDTYNALQIQTQKRYSSGLSFNLSYTWSQNLSDGGAANGGGNWTPQNARCVSCGWGPTTDSATQVLVFSHEYDLPFGPGRKFVSRGLAGALLGNWELNGIWTAQTGLHFTATYSAAVSNSSGGGSQRPDRICDGNLPSGQRTLTAWFNTSCFVSPAQYAFGNSGSGILVGPGFFNLDLGIHRDFRIKERYRLVYRAEAFNTFNHANFGVPGASIGSSTAGVISSASAARVVQMALKMIF